MGFPLLACGERPGRLALRLEFTNRFHLPVAVGIGPQRASLRALQMTMAIFSNDDHVWCVLTQQPIASASTLSLSLMPSGH
jgi:hypothetical protein